jgi:hypothetical protein
MDFRDDKPDAYMRFAECGFSERIIGVLIRAGLDAPEQLLSMAPDRIRLIQGMGPILMKEIERYRAQFNNEETAKRHVGQKRYSSEQIVPR